MKRASVDRMKDRREVQQVEGNLRGGKLDMCESSRWFFVSINVHWPACRGDADFFHKRYRRGNATAVNNTTSVVMLLDEYAR